MRSQNDERDEREIAVRVKEDACFGTCNVRESRQYLVRYIIK